jgi:hypothetical protein
VIGTIPPKIENKMHACSGRAAKYVNQLRTESVTTARGKNESYMPSRAIRNACDDGAITISHTELLLHGRTYSAGPRKSWNVMKTLVNLCCIGDHSDANYLTILCGLQCTWVSEKVADENRMNPIPRPHNFRRSIRTSRLQVRYPF